MDCIYLGQKVRRYITLLPFLFLKPDSKFGKPLVSLCQLNGIRLIGQRLPGI
jgi:hypothetical protein